MLLVTKEKERERENTPVSRLVDSANYVPGPVVVDDLKVYVVFFPFYVFPSLIRTSHPSRTNAVATNREINLTST